MASRLAALRAGGAYHGVGDGIYPPPRRASRRSCGGRLVGGRWSRCCGENRDRCCRAATEAVAALADPEHGEAYEYDAAVDSLPACGLMRTHLWSEIRTASLPLTLPGGRRVFGRSIAPGYCCVLPRWRTYPAVRGAAAAKQTDKTFRYFYCQRRGLTPRRGLRVRPQPEHHRAQSCRAAAPSPSVRSPARSVEYPSSIIYLSLWSSDDKMRLLVSYLFPRRFADIYAWSFNIWSK